MEAILVNTNVGWNKLRMNLMWEVNNAGFTSMVDTTPRCVFALLHV